MGEPTSDDGRQAPSANCNCWLQDAGSWKRVEHPPQTRAHAHAGDGDESEDPDRQMQILCAHPISHPSLFSISDPRYLAMINFQDELAWLNHKVDEILEAWRKLHRFQGRLFYTSVNSIAILLMIYICNGFYWKVENSAWLSPPAVFSGNLLAGTVWPCLLFVSLSILVFSWLSRNMHTKLLKKGHALKGRIYDARTHNKSPDNKSDEQVLSDLQQTLAELLNLERSFPCRGDRRHRITIIRYIRFPLIKGIRRNANSRSTSVSSNNRESASLGT
jgi:hypothetical protein